MAIFDALIGDLTSRFGLGANAATLVREVLAMISASPQGLGGFLDKLKSGGLASEVGTWLGSPNAAPIATGQVERALGPTAVSGIAARLGLGHGVVSTALGYALPKIVGLLTPRGVVPAGLPAEVEAFLGQPRAAAAAVAEQVAPLRIDVLPASAESQSGVGRWLWPALAALVVLAGLGYFWSTSNQTTPPPVAKTPEPATPAPVVVKAPEPAPATVAQAPATPPPAAPAPQSAMKSETPAPAPSAEASAGAPPASPQPATQTSPPASAPAAAVSPPTTAEASTTPPPAAVATAEPSVRPSAAAPTRLALTNDNGVMRASGIVHDQDVKTSIVDTLNAAYGADKVKSDISIDPSAIGASWLGKFQAALDAIKGANVDAIFQGDKINIGGAALSGDARDKVVAALKSAVGAGVTVGALTDQTTSAAAATPTRFALSNDNGVVRASGVVANEDAKTSIVDALNAVFSADKVKSDIGIDPSAVGASWLGKFRAALDVIKGANVDAIFQGDKINVGGAGLSDDARDKIIAGLKSAVGAGVAIGALTDQTAAAVSIANDRATTQLASLQSGFGVKDLLFALNASVVNFASDSAEVPEAADPFLKTAATALKQLKAGHVLEIAGYTDNTGDAALNLALSGKRAEAVRDALIKYGADADMLVAKGYGEADPIGDNGTAEGRLKNRRIEYHVVKAPT